MSALGRFALTASHTDGTPGEPWMPTRAVARRCGVTDETVRDWRRSGKLSAKRTPGGHYRFDPVEVDALLKDDTTTEIEVAV